MRVLLDENIPLKLVQDFADFDCHHVVTLGWSGVKNGHLLARAEEAGFKAIVTFDDGIPVEHDLSAKPFAVIILKPEGQGVRSTRLLLPLVFEALANCSPGEATVITNRTRMRSIQPPLD